MTRDSESLSVAGSDRPAPAMYRVSLDYGTFTSSFRTPDFYAALSNVDCAGLRGVTVELLGQPLDGFSWTALDGDGPDALLTDLAADLRRRTLPSAAASTPASGSEVSASVTARLAETVEAIEAAPVPQTTVEIARTLGCTQAAARGRLARAVELGLVRRLGLGVYGPGASA